MNRDDIIRMAREAGFEIHERKQQARVGMDAMFGIDSTDKLEHFSAIVVANFMQSSGQYLTNDASRDAAILAAVLAEREACAKLCEVLDADYESPLGCAAAIRARKTA